MVIESGYMSEFDLLEAESRDDLTVIMGFNGGKGSGKSLFLAYQAIHDMCELERKVWSNMKVHTGRYYEKRYGYHETLPLDIDLLYMLDKGIAEGTIILDEVQNLSDSRTSLSLKNRLLNGMLYQVRKRQLRIFYSIKQGSWCDKRLAYETDVRCECFNLGKSPWGREHNIKGGRLIRYELWDESGIITGRPADKYSQPYKKGIFTGGRKLYDCFNSWETTDLEEIYSKVRLDMKERVLTNKTYDDELLPVVSEVIDSLVSRNITEIPCNSFRELVLSSGIDANQGSIGSLVRQLGVSRKQKSDGSRVYLLPGT